MVDQLVTVSFLIIAIIVGVVIGGLILDKIKSWKDARPNRIPIPKSAYKPKWTTSEDRTELITENVKVSDEGSWLTDLPPQVMRDRKRVNAEDNAIKADREKAEKKVL